MSKTSPQIIVFDGVEYRCYGKSNYFCCSRQESDHSSKGLLHRDVWCFYHGEISTGHDVHHKDGDTTNNDISNLECLSRAEHARRHSGYCSPAKRAHVDRVRPLTKAWHASAEGRAWHSEHAKRAAAARQPVDKTCSHCGAKYQTTSAKRGDRFCSRACISKANEAARRYYEDRQCVVCGNTFNAKKSKPQRTCSGKCAWVIRRGTRGGLQSDS